MKTSRRVCINARHSKKSILVNSALKTEESSSLNDVWQYSDTSTIGIVISHRQGIGEVLIEDSFKDPKVHYIFNSKTCITMTDESERLAVGSNVQISWSKNSKPAAEGLHLNIQIELMRVFQCTKIFHDKVQLIYNSQSVLGVALGLNEKYHEVAFHPSCSPEVSFETFKAAAEGRTEFEVSLNRKENNRVTLKVDAKILIAPFLIGASGSAGKCRRFVIDHTRIENFENYAVITQFVPNMFMEARYLENYESIYCSMKACHSNVMRRISVGTIVFIKASPTFDSCLYEWYGYDVTIANPKDPVRIPKHPGAKKILEKTRKIEGMTRKVINSDKREESAIKDMARLTDRSAETAAPEQLANPQKIVTIKTYKDQLILNTVGRKLKLRYHLLGGCKMNFDPHKAKRILKSYIVEEKVHEEEEIGNVSRKSYDVGTKTKVEKVLADFNLLKPSNSTSPPPHLSQRDLFPVLQEQTVESSETNRRIRVVTLGDPKPSTKYSMETVLEKIPNKDGYPLTTRFAPKFVFPDTKWQPKERRTIGIHDDLKWIMMETFAKDKTELEKMTDENLEDEKEKPLADGWWYRRSCQRFFPTKLTTELNPLKKNILKECTEEIIEY